MDTNRSPCLKDIYIQTINKEKWKKSKYISLIYIYITINLKLAKHISISESSCHLFRKLNFTFSAPSHLNQCWFQTDKWKYLIASLTWFIYFHRKIQDNALQSLRPGEAYIYIYIYIYIYSEVPLYNMVIFLQNPHNRHLIAHLWGRDMGCLLWV